MNKLGRPKTDPIKRFWSKVQKTNDCWLWTCTTDLDGYGLFGVDGKQWRAHRFCKLITDGLDSSKPVVMHTCDNPRCVNPEHLVNGTIKENNLDKKSKRRDTKEFWGSNWGSKYRKK